MSGRARRSKSAGNRGSTLILVLVLTVLLAGLGVCVLSTSFSFHRTSREILSRDQAYWAAESAGGYYLSLVSGDRRYFETHPAPQGAVVLGDSSFRLESARLVEGATDQWLLYVHGFHDDVRFPLEMVIGPRMVPVPAGVIAVGPGGPGDGEEDEENEEDGEGGDSGTSVIRLRAGSRIASHDPEEGPFDPEYPGDAAMLLGRGDLSLGSGVVHGDATITGTAREGAGSSITGVLTERAPDFQVEDIDSIATSSLEGSRSSNDNGSLRAIFGAQWNPALGLENYGDLIVTKSGDHVVPSGTYRFRKLEVRGGARVIFDTTGGSSRVVCAGDPWALESEDGLVVTGGSSLMVSPGSTRNVLQVVLESGVGVSVDAGSTLGRSVEEPENGGYTQIIGRPGGSSSGEIRVSGSSTAHGRVYATGHSLVIERSGWFGSALVRTVRLIKSSFVIDTGSAGRSLVHPTEQDVLARWAAPEG